MSSTFQSRLRNHYKERRQSFNIYLIGGYVIIVTSQRKCEVSLPQDLTDYTLNSSTVNSL